MKTTIEVQIENYQLARLKECAKKLSLTLEATFDEVLAHGLIAFTDEYIKEWRHVHWGEPPPISSWVEKVILPSFSEATTLYRS